MLIGHLHFLGLKDSLGSILQRCANNVFDLTDQLKYIKHTCYHDLPSFTGSLQVGFSIGHCQRQPKILFQVMTAISPIICMVMIPFWHIWPTRPLILPWSLILALSGNYHGLSDKLVGQYVACKSYQNGFCAYWRLFDFASYCVVKLYFDQYDLPDHQDWLKDTYQHSKASAMGFPDKLSLQVCLSMAWLQEQLDIYF